METQADFSSENRKYLEENVFPTLRKVLNKFLSTQYDPKKNEFKTENPLRYIGQCLKRCKKKREIQKIEHEGKEYEGEVNLQEKPEGYGKIRMNNGSQYIGYFSNGKMHGKGRLLMQNGNLFIGEFQNNMHVAGHFYKEEEGKKIKEEWVGGEMIKSEICLNWPKEVDFNNLLKCCSEKE